MVREALLYDLRNSPACTKARICLQLKGVPYRRVPPSIGDVLRGPQVPWLVLEDETVVPAERIGSHLDAHHPDPPLVPADAEARAYCSLLEGWADASLGAAVERSVWGPPASRRRMARAVAQEVTSGPLIALVAAVLARRAARLACAATDARALLRERVAVLEAVLGERTFLLGKTVSRADVAAFAQLACVRRAAEDVPLQCGPALAAWMHRLAADPAVESAFEP
jgi:glutathione S-transferase